MSRALDASRAYITAEIRCSKVISRDGLHRPPHLCTYSISPCTSWARDGDGASGVGSKEREGGLGRKTE